MVVYFYSFNIFVTHIDIPFAFLTLFTNFSFFMIILIGAHSLFIFQDFRLVDILYIGLFFSIFLSFVSSIKAENKIIIFIFFKISILGLWINLITKSNYYPQLWLVNFLNNLLLKYFSLFCDCLYGLFKLFPLILNCKFLTIAQIFIDLYCSFVKLNTTVSFNSCKFIVIF